MSRSGGFGVLLFKCIQILSKKCFVELDQMLEIPDVMLQCLWSCKFYFLLFIFIPELMNA